MEKELKEGDVLICHKSCIMYDDDEISTTVGKSYIIEGFVGDCLRISDDYYKIHYFSLDDENDEENYYEHWLFSPKLSRKRKLKKIKDAEIH